MKKAFFGSVHSNIYALESTLKKIKDDKPDEIYCLGDLIGYFNEPRRVVELIRSKKIKCVYGNHELVLLGRLKPSLSQYDIILADGYNAGKLFYISDKKNKLETIVMSDIISFLNSLPHTISEEDFIISHANPFNLEFKPIWEMGELEKYLSKIITQEKKFIITCHGNRTRIIRIHKKIGYDIFGFEGNEYILETDLKEEDKFWINLASVGGPYEIMPCVEYLLLEKDKQTFKIKISRQQYNGYNLIQDLETDVFYKNFEFVKKTIALFKQHGIIEKNKNHVETNSSFLSFIL